VQSNHRLTRHRSHGWLAAELLDDLIRPLQERRRDRQPQGLGGLEVDDQLELRGLLNPGACPGHGTSDKRLRKNET
jgi:hypothetical protein